MKRFKDIGALNRFLDGIPKFQNTGVSSVNYSLDKILYFCKDAGYIHEGYPVIHVAGTNGKGSTCFLLEHLYREAGYKTALFTSPHLISYNERVRINGEPISDERMLDFFNRHHKLIKKYHLSYFEISTALAFSIFKEESPDIAILEVGLGGRLDATNIVDPEVTAITSISLDHTDILGSELKDIAREKAGIIKPGVPVVIGDLPDKAEAVVKEIAESNKSSLHKASDLDPQFEGGKVEFSGGLWFNTHFLEPVNKWNVAICRKITEQLQQSLPLSKEQFHKGVESFPGVPARFERLLAYRNWYFSGAHNLESIISSLETYHALKQEGEKVLVLSMMSDKITPEVTDRLDGFDRRIYFEQISDRAARAGDLGALNDLQMITEENSRDIFRELETSLVIFMGSFYFYPIVKRWISQIDQKNTDRNLSSLPD